MASELARALTGAADLLDELESLRIREERRMISLSDMDFRDFVELRLKGGSLTEAISACDFSFEAATRRDHCRIIVRGPRMAISTIQSPFEDNLDRLHDLLAEYTGKKPIIKLRFKTEKAGQNE